MTTMALPDQTAWITLLREYEALCRAIDASVGSVASLVGDISRAVPPEVS